MDANALVLASHVIILALFALVVVSWVKWFATKWRSIMGNATGLLAVAFAVLAVVAAWEAAYYGVARGLLEFHDIDLWRGGASPYAIATIRTVGIGSAMVLALIARWRIDDMPVEAIRRRLETLLVAAICLYAGAAAWLW